MIHTSHIRAMLAEAQRLADLVDGQPAFDDIADGDGAWPAHVLLERAENLAAHAAHELADERIRNRHQLPVV